MDYVIDGGQSGKSRLSILSQAMNEYSIRALQKAGLRVGDKCLDLGCGGGDMSYVIAQIVGESGHVTGIDYDTDIIALNNKELAEKNIPNIIFESKSAYDLDAVEQYDLIYARYLLSHLGDPALLLEKIYAALRPGGRLLVEDIQFSGHVCYPQNEAFATYLDWYQRLVSNMGGNAERGAILYNDLSVAGFSGIGVSIAQPVGAYGPAKQMALLTLEKISAALLSSGIATRDEYEHVRQQLAELTQHENVVMSIARTWQVWGQKA